MTKNKQSLFLGRDHAMLVDKNNPQALKGKTLNYSAALEIRYARAIVALINQMTAQTMREIKSIYKTEAAKELFAADASVASQARIVTNKLKAKFEQLFATKADDIVKDMIENAKYISAANLKGSLREMAAGVTLNTSAITPQMKDILSASATENVSLIKSIQTQYHDRVQGAVMRSIVSGNGLQDLVPELLKYEGMTIRRARYIAKDQTKKVYNGLNEGRMQALGLDKYEWIHSHGDVHPRQLHLELHGTICSLSDPPVIQHAKGSLPEVKGKPGDLPGCTCKMRPIVSFDRGDDVDK